MKKYVSVICMTLLLAACASDKDKYKNMPAEDLYNVAWEHLEETKYKDAAKEFERVETDHPYSQWAVKAKIMGAYAYYKDEKYDDAVLALDRFIKYHPGNKDIDYAYYLRGMCYYSQISAADKDQGNTAMAEETFRRLIMLFPESKYAEDARNKINLTEDYKAGQEMIIGRYYLKDKNYLSALNRFNVVLENYQTTIQIEEALYREVEIYAILGLNKYADGYYKILKKNYPEGKWTEKAKNIMQKLNNSTDKKVAKEDAKAKLKTENKKSENDEKSWFDFSTWWSNDNDENFEKDKKVESEQEVKTKENWFDFSTWWSNDNATNIEHKDKNEAEVKDSSLLDFFKWNTYDKKSDKKEGE